MNPEDRDTPTPKGAGIDPREWEAQERALRAERLKLDAGHADARTAQYRMIARALRQPPVSPMPADFAAQVAARVAGAPRVDERVEAWLQRLLSGLLAVVAAGALAMYGPQWMPAFSGLLPDGAGAVTGWAGAVALCAAMTWGLQHLRRGDDAGGVPG